VRHCVVPATAMPSFQRFIALALSWLDSNLEHFDPFLESQRPSLFRSKALLELALLSFYYNRVGLYHKDRQLERFLDFITEIWKRSEYHDLIVRQPRHFRLYGMLHIVLRACHRLDKSFDGVLQRIIDGGYVTALEYEPFRRLELRYILDTGKIRHNLPSQRSLYSATLLAKLPPPPYLTEYDMYTITHTIFYISDFSLREIQVIPSRQYPSVVDYIDVLLGICTRMRHWDLVAELLLCCVCLRAPQASFFDIAWRSLIQMQREDGSIPGPMRVEEVFGESRDHLDRAACAFRQDYHTTLVSVLAAVLTSDRRI
jgi:hypothetical protein